MYKGISGNKLLIISDTAVYDENGVLSAFEPVVREIESIESLFDEIIWLGCKTLNKKRALQVPKSKKIRIIQMPAVAGSSWIVNKLKILIGYPVFLFYILKYLPKVTHVHTRAPSHPAFIAILISFIDRGRTYWHKYAGNWVEEKLAFTYDIQRQLLKRTKAANVRVTVNGEWNNKSKQVFAFENPCIYESERITAAKIATDKNFVDKLSLLFVGNLVEFKGIGKLIEVIEQGKLPQSINKVFIVGNGPMYDNLKQRIEKINAVNIELLGHLKRTDINNYYSQANIIILPSSTEGFPKVIAEGAAFGCIPVVTDISSLSQYIIEGETGFLIKEQTPVSILTALQALAANENLKQISLNAMKMCNRFTYEYFKDRMAKTIFNISQN